MPETHDLLQSIQGLVPRIDDVLTALDNGASAWTTYRVLYAAELQAKARFNEVSGETDRINIERMGAEWKETVDKRMELLEKRIEPTHERVVALSDEVMDALRSLPATPPELRATRDEIERLMLSVGLLTDLHTDGGGTKYAQLLSLEDRRRDLLSMKCRLTEMERLLSSEPASERSIPNPIRPHPPAVAASSNKPSGRQTHQVSETREQRASRRRDFVSPILDRFDWTPGKLATEAAVGKTTVYEYLNGKRKSISRPNRKALADTLQVELKDLPK